MGLLIIFIMYSLYNLTYYFNLKWFSLECQSFVKMRLQFSIAHQSKTQRLFISFHNWERNAAYPHIQEAGTSK